MAKLINGSEIAKKIRGELAQKVKKEKLNPNFAVVLCGDNEASKVYVRIKSKACEEVGIAFQEYHLKKETTQEELFELIDKLNNDETIDGILIQAPLPKGLNYREAADRIAPEKDVDGFNSYNVGRLTIGDPTFIPCTPYGIMKMFEECEIDLVGKKVVIVGRSNIVGKPMAQCLINASATVTICHSKTKDLKKELKDADIVIAAVGVEALIKADMLKEGVIVIDVGMNRNKEGKLCGDIDFNEVEKIASYITPVPGGVGPMTVAMLMNNVIKAHCGRKAKNDCRGNNK